MKNEYDFEAAKKIIDDESNVTETNLMKDLFRMIVQFALILVVIYYSVYAVSGVAISNLTVDKQVKFEKLLSSMNSWTVIETDADKERFGNIKNEILRVDRSFPSTTSLNIHVMKNSSLNAFCAPNGDIYITSELYKRLEDDKILTFIIAHEMAHYRNKDHLMAFRKNISNAFVFLFVTVVSSNSSQITSVTKGVVEMSDLKYSRAVEAKADKYAAKILLKLYNSVEPGVEALRIIDKESFNSPELLSTHPDTKKRIRNLRALKFK